jgi:EmrB/QacA subfamily drug resistance transporter
MSPEFHQPQSKAEADPRRWLAMAVLLLASFMNLIDVTIVNVALPSMESGLGAGSSQIEWVVAAYILAFALGLLPFGRLGDIVGRTHMFLVGVAAFTAASALCGFSPSIEWLIAARVLQGFAGAMMAPQVLAIATVTFPPEERGQAFALFGLSTGLAAVAGPIVGGLLLEGNFLGLEWRPIFLVNVPVGILALVSGWLIIPRPPGHAALKNDYVGIALFSAAMVALVYPLVEGRSFGWPAWCWGLIVAAFVLLALFVLWERRMAAHDRPQLLNFSLLTNGQFLLGSLTTVIFASGIPAFFMIFSLMLQSGFGLTPLESGLTNTPFSVGVFLTSLIIGRFGSAFLRARLAAGAALLAIGMLWTHLLISGLGTTVNHWDFLPPLFVAGVGLGLAISALFQTILAGIPGRDAGAGSGALQAMQQVGGAVGIALVGEIFFTSLDGARGAGAQSVQQAFAWAASHATWYEVACFVAVVLLAIFLRSRGTPVVRTGSAPVRVTAEA